MHTKFGWFICNAGHIMMVCRHCWSILLAEFEHNNFCQCLFPLRIPGVWW